MLSRDHSVALMSTVSVWSRAGAGQRTAAPRVLGYSQLSGPRRPDSTAPDSTLPPGSLFHSKSADSNQTLMKSANKNDSNFFITLNNKEIHFGHNYDYEYKCFVTEFQMI